jgi:hypothetical protein
MLSVRVKKHKAIHTERDGSRLGTCAVSGSSSTCHGEALIFIDFEVSKAVQKHLPVLNSRAKDRHSCAYEINVLPLMI